MAHTYKIERERESERMRKRERAGEDNIYRRILKNC